MLPVICDVARPVKFDSMAEEASNQTTDIESVGMQKQVEDMFLSECSGEEAKARIKFLGPEGLHTMRAEVEQNTQHKEGAVKRTYQHVLQNAFKEHVFRHKTEEATFLPVMSAYSL